ncbi:MAG TPA: hypothetical protein EYG92_10940 [Lutibacter sp.]|nr:hypothetical protein [Lutibacter sp.]
MSFFFISINIYTQNPDGSLILKVKNGCKTINFILNKHDTIFVDKKNQFTIKIIRCHQGCHPIVNGWLRYNNYPTNNILNISYKSAKSIEIIITKKSNPKKKMKLFYDNIGEWYVESEIRFKKGNYKIDLKKTYVRVVRLKHFDKIK